MGLEIERTEAPPRSTASRSPPDRKSARNPAKARQAGEFSMAVTSRSIAIAFTSARRCAARAVASDALARERAATPREGSGTAREAMFAGRNRGAWIATAFRMTNFDLDAATRIGGIKLGTVRDETLLSHERRISFQSRRRQVVRQSRCGRGRASTYPRGGHGIAKTWKAALDREVRDDPNAR